MRTTGIPAKNLLEWWPLGEVGDREVRTVAGPLGITAAVAAGATFAAAGVLQQRVASRMPTEYSLSIRLVRSLAREPLWLAGILLAAASYGLQALALSAAPLAVVQPLLVTELVFAIPVSARLSGRHLGARGWYGIVTVSGGIAATVWGAPPSGGDAGTPVRWVTAAGALGVMAAALALAGRWQRPVVRASMFAAAAALVFALSSAFLTATVAGFAADGPAALLDPAPYAVCAASLTGLLLVQSAFQAGPLAVTMPMLDWLEPLVAVVLGVTVLGESLDTRPGHLAALTAGAIAALAGIVALDTSPGVHGSAGVTPAPRAAVDAAAAACASRAARSGHGLTEPTGRSSPQRRIRRAG